MCERFGDAFRNLPREKISPFSAFMKAFEKIKCKFDKSTGTIHRLSLIMSIKKPLNAKWYDKRWNSVLLSRLIPRSALLAQDN